MSRSYKKPWVKDSSTYMKKVHARKVRSRVKQILHEFKKNMNPEWDCWYWYGKCQTEIEALLKTPVDPDIPHPLSVTNKYDICDWRYYVDEPECRRK